MDGDCPRGTDHAAKQGALPQGVDRGPNASTHLARLNALGWELKSDIRHRISVCSAAWVRSAMQHGFRMRKGRICGLYVHVSGATALVGPTRHSVRP